jgi:acyl carrier protein
MKVTTSQEAWKCVVESIQEMLQQQGEEVDEVKPTQALFGNLGIASVNIIHLLVTMEDKLDMPLNFHKLVMRGVNSPANDITVGDLHQFICQSLNLC